MQTVVDNSTDGARKVALVTGGAAGIGLAIAKALIARDCAVIIGDVDEQRGREAAAEAGADFFPLDVADEACWVSAMAFIDEAFGHLDILVNNAGIYLPGSIEDAGAEDWAKVQSVNVVGVILGSRYAIGAMKLRGGSIVNISSGAALRPNSSAALYSATKSAVWSLTRTTALHCAERNYNIRCNSVHPGMVDTDMVFARAGDEQTRKELYEKSDKLHPLGRMARVEDIAAAVTFLVSDAAAYITGVALPVDGGYAIN